MRTHWCVLLNCSGDFKRRLPRTPSTGTMSSADDLDEREPPSPSDVGESNRKLRNVKSCSHLYCCNVLSFSLHSAGLSDLVIETASSPGPFRNTQLSKAAQTHKLRKLRAPSKCRECDSLVVFHGAECEEVQDTHSSLLFNYNTDQCSVKQQLINYNELCQGVFGLCSITLQCIKENSLRLFI